MSQIFARLDIAIERSSWRYPEEERFRCFYLDKTDWAAYDAAVSKEWGSPCYSFSYRDIPIRSGNKSRLITQHGICVCVPKKVSSKTLEEPLR